MLIKIDNDDDWCWIKKSVKQLRAENYKVKTTEICLAPNQKQHQDKDLELLEKDEPETNCEVPIQKNLEEDVEEILSDGAEKKSTPEAATSDHDTRKHEYRLRRKSRVDYKSLNSGKVIRCTEQIKPAPPRFGWNTESSSSEDEDILKPAPPPIITQFRSWLSRQP